MKKNIFIFLLLIIICVLSYKLYGLNDEYLTLDSIYQTTQTRLIASNKKISNLNTKISNYETQIKFMDKAVAICPADGTGLYHKYGCEKLDMSDGVWIYNTNQAPIEGFSPCFYCSDLDNTQDESEIVVYVTNTGDKYHRDNCSYLKSKKPITLERALSQGYDACSRCNPPKGK